MSIFLFLMHFFTTLWPVVVIFGCWVGARRGQGWRERLAGGAAWGAGAWLLAGAAFVLLYLLEQGRSRLLPEGVNGILFVGVGAVLMVAWLARRAARLALRQRLSDRNEALAWLQELPAAEFEALAARYFKSRGYVVRRVGQSGDHGVDLAVYTPDEGKWIVQCKRYRRRSVGEGAVRDLYGAMMHEHADRGLIFTTSTFSVHAQEWAAGKPIELVDGDALVARLYQGRVSLVKTAPAGTEV